jgi:hypothetical protein
MEQTDVLESPIETTAAAGAGEAAAAAASGWEPNGGPRTGGPSHEQIAALAYSYWEERGGQGGSAEEDWLRAEQGLSPARQSS